jgi:hypothetical protein
VNARAATSNVARNALQPNRSHRVDRQQARRYISLRSRAAAGTGRRKASPSEWIGRGGASPRERSTEVEEATVPGSPGRLGPPFDGSRNRVDNARVWGRRERIQRFLGPSIRVRPPTRRRGSAFEPPATHSGEMTITPFIPNAARWIRQNSV